MKAHEHILKGQRSEGPLWYRNLTTLVLCVIAKESFWTCWCSLCLCSQIFSQHGVFVCLWPYHFSSFFYSVLFVPYFYDRVGPRCILWIFVHLVIIVFRCVLMDSGWLNQSWWRQPLWLQFLRRELRSWQVLAPLCGPSKIVLCSVICCTLFCGLLWLLAFVSQVESWRLDS